MTIQRMIPQFGLALALAMVLSLPADTFAQHVNYEYGHNPDRIVIRRTIPDPHAVKRSPLTSDRPDGLWPTVVTDERGVALGLAYSSLESVRRALETVGDVDLLVLPGEGMRQVVMDREISKAKS